MSTQLRQQIKAIFAEAERDPERLLHNLAADQLSFIVITMKGSPRHKDIQKRLDSLGLHATYVFGVNGKHLVPTVHEGETSFLAPKDSRVTRIDAGVRDNRDGVPWNTTVACCASHALAIEAGLALGGPFAVLEDDAFVEAAVRWGTPLGEILEGMPKNWQCLSLNETSSHGHIKGRTRKKLPAGIVPWAATGRSVYNWGAQMYVITPSAVLRKLC